jgi:predicted DNA-binding transcriptional regulator YafY/predicted Zn-dependent protease
MLASSARLLRLLSLLQARRFWSGRELSERLEVTERTLRRDVDRLRSLGYPVNATSGVAGGYQLGAGAALPPLLLEDDEALAVALGLRLASSGSLAGLEETAVRSLSKLEQLLPARLRRRIQTLAAAIEPLPWGGPRVSTEILTALASACRDQDRIQFSYEDRGAKQAERHVEPHGVVHASSRWYLVAWDLAREDWRTFRVDRIRGKLTRGKRFVPRPIPEGGLAAYVSRSVSTRAHRYQARVVLHASFEHASERISPLAGRLEPLTQDRCVLETGGQHLEGLGVYIASTGLEFTVESPPELIEHMVNVAARMTRAVERAQQRTTRRQRAARTVIGALLFLGGIACGRPAAQEAGIQSARAAPRSATLSEAHPTALESAWQARSPSAGAPQVSASAPIASPGAPPNVTQAETLVYLQPLGSELPELDTAYVAQALTAFYRVRVLRLEPKPLPDAAKNAAGTRYRAEKLLTFLLNRMPDDGRFILGLTGADISTTKGAVADWGILGLATLEGSACIISAFRTRRGARGAGHARERLGKVAVHELGHNLGLDHCPTHGCLMEDAQGTVFTTDREYDLCERCRARLGESVRAEHDTAVPWQRPER